MIARCVAVLPLQLLTILRIYCVWCLMENTFFKPYNTHIHTFIIIVFSNVRELHYSLAAAQPLCTMTKSTAHTTTTRCKPKDPKWTNSIWLPPIPPPPLINTRASANCEVPTLCIIHILDRRVVEYAVCAKNGRSASILIYYYNHLQ